MPLGSYVTAGALNARSGKVPTSWRKMADPSQVVSDYDVSARSTDVFGWVLCGVRDHHFVIDGPVQNGCPGEEVTPVEGCQALLAHSDPA